MDACDSRSRMRTSSRRADQIDAVRPLSGPDQDLDVALVQGVAEIERIAGVAAVRGENPDSSISEAPCGEGEDPL